MVNDHAGIVDHKLAYADISYTLKFTNNAKLSLGMKGGVNYLSIGLATYNVSMPNTTISQKLKLLDAQVLNLFH
jgi:hypothetical protein